METKLVGARASKAAEALGFPRKVIVDADGLAGGIWLLWDDKKFCVDILSTSPQVIHATVQVHTIETTVTTHFKSLYSTSLTHSFHDSFNNIQNGHIVSSSSWHLLTSPPSDSEIKKAIFSMKPFKAPGPDGLHATFFQKFWLLLKDKLCLEIRDIFSSGVMPDSWSASLIALIPKNSNPESISQFRPIGLCNVPYKIVTKIIVLRLKELMGDLISPMQSSFLPGQNGIDNVILLREFVHSFHKRKGRQGDMIVKLDLEKAFDRLEWSFIKEALIFSNLPPLMIKLIMSCISSTSLSCIINGGATDSFKPCHGLRQGDPLSPYLFILCLEFLLLKLHHDISIGLWKGSKLGKSKPLFSHIFFTDDLIFAGKASISNASYLKEMLDFFCFRSRQSINQEKSKVFFSTNVNSATRYDICQTLGYVETLSLGKYLGFPISPKKVKKSNCAFIVDKVRSKIAGWKANKLSLAERATLASSVLSSIPNYYMQGMDLPASVHSELDTISRNFIWGSTSNKRKANLVSWERITQPKKVGGIGIKANKEANQAAMPKLHWRMTTKTHKPWAKAFISKYKIKTPLHNFSTLSSPVCKDISKGRDIIEKGISWIPRDGSRILFWQDKWLFKESLCSIYHGPFRPHDFFITLKDILLPDGKWNLDIIAYPLSQDIMQKIIATPIQKHSSDQDSFIWNSASNGKFSMKSTYYMAKNIQRPQDENWKQLSIIQLKHTTLDKAQEFIKHNPTHIESKPKNTISVGWVPPPDGFVKLNTNGSALGNPSITRAGGLLRDHLERLSDVQIIHIYREANAAADFMAKLGTSSVMDFVLYEESPPGISSILFHDRIGTIFPRTSVTA
ncbi:hypothetical protein SLEP1_g28713 [Rubroshorea leprosula]|uniref:Reverse transcriptase domain-containing protein n=1 Tax=Rubroshorea leprosula TaxID=152421 RepID=A0AAV5K5R3_9ROSI|nr:hypothetical protein SLEP1_g28713 [Rubroshorea leprosula]